MKRQPIDSEFHNRLEEAIFNSNLDINEICQRAEMVRSTLWYYRFNGGIPNAGTLKRLCIALNVSSDWMLGISKEKEIKR